MLVSSCADLRHHQLDTVGSVGAKPVVSIQQRQRMPIVKPVT